MSTNIQEARIMKVFNQDVQQIKRFTIGKNDYDCFELDDCVLICKNGYPVVHTPDDLIELRRTPLEVLKIPFERNTIAKLVNTNKKGVLLYGDDYR